MLSPLQMSDMDDDWTVFGSRPASAASMFPDSQRDDPYPSTRSPDTPMQATYTKPKKYASNGNPPRSSPQPWKNRTYSSKSNTNRSTSRTLTPTSQHGQNYFMAKSRGKGQHTASYVDETLFGEKNQPEDSSWQAPWHEKQTSKQQPWDQNNASPQNSNRCSSAASQYSKQRNYYGKKWNVRNASYADELLFGERPEEPDFKAPWGKSEKKQFVFDATDYKAMEIKKQLQSAAKKSKSKRMTGPVAADSERVEHMERKIRSQLSVRGEQSRPQSRADGTPRSATPSTPKKHTKQPKFKDTYVDEMLFGPKPVEPDFRAPWESTKRQTIHAFDGTNSTPTIHHDGSSSSRPGSAKRRSSTNSTLRAPWK